MEDKVTISSLSAGISRATGKSKKLCDDFLREFFRMVSETLVEGETIKIKGFGTFKITEVDSRNSTNVNTGERQEIAAYKKVVFTPSKELASIINAPFEEFETIEMEDEWPDEIFYDEGDKDERGEENNVSAGIIEAGSEEEGEDDTITYEAYETLEAEKEKEVAPEPTHIPPPIPRNNKEETQSPETSVPEEEPRVVNLPVPYVVVEKKGRFRLGFLTGALSALLVCVIIFMLGCFFDWWPENFGNIKDFWTKAPETEVVEVPEEAPIEEKEIESTPEIEEDVPKVYDTVSTTRYLSTIAQEHYGDFNFWPYIYMENQSILGHPNRITPGTQVVVPPLSKYGVDPGNKDDVEKAKQEGAAIYARYK